MNKKLLTLALIFGLLSFVSCSQGQTQQNSTVKQEQKQIEVPIYQLFPTENYWTFIKLDTRNGKMWQVHFTVSDKGGRGEVILNSLPLVNADKEVNGRFTLYSTKNMYNFILLDQIDGTTYQVQWSMDEKNRGVIPIY